MPDAAGNFKGIFVSKLWPGHPSTGTAETLPEQPSVTSDPLPGPEPSKTSDPLPRDPRVSVHV